MNLLINKYTKSLLLNAYNIIKSDVIIAIYLFCLVNSGEAYAINGLARSDVVGQGYDTRLY